VLHLLSKLNSRKKQDDLLLLLLLLQQQLLLSHRHQQLHRMSLPRKRFSFL
jgi:hypothetical protein